MCKEYESDVKVEHIPWKMSVLREKSLYPVILIDEQVYRGKYEQPNEAE